MAQTATPEITMQELAEIARGFSDAAWIRAYVRIEDQDSGQAIPFDLWPAQVEALDAFEMYRLVCVLKARQLGLTWLALAYSVRQMLKRPYRVTALSKGLDESKELVRRATFILSHLPSWVVVRGKPVGEVPGWEGTTERITITHPKGAQSFFNSFSAGPDSGRTFTSSLVLIDEWAFQDYARQIWSAAYPTINRPGGGKVIGLSSGQQGSLHEEIFLNAQRAQNSFYPLFLSVWSDPRRTPEWYAQTKRDMPDTWPGEYPEVYEDAFRSLHGRPFFGSIMEMLRKRKAEATSGVCGYLTFTPANGTPASLKFEPDPEGWLRVWNAPEKGHQYAIGADVAEGLEKGDYSAAEVIDRQTGEHVAEWHGHIDADLYGVELVRLARWYNNAWVAAEANNYGIATNKAIAKSKYTRLMNRPDSIEQDDLDVDETDKLGWLTTEVSRKYMTETLRSSMREGSLVPNGNLVSECITFVYNEKGKAEAQPGCYDDRVMAAAIALQVHQICPLRTSDARPPVVVPSNRAAGY